MSVVSSALDSDLLSCEQLAQSLYTQGWAVADEFVSTTLAHDLRTLALDAWENGEYRQARVGHGELAQTQLSVRGDRIMWLNEQPQAPAFIAYLERLESLRVAVNRALMLGLFEWEGHLAMYPPGSFYRRHLDVFAHAKQRQLSTILYLNEGWQPEDGGQLRMYLDGANLAPHLDLAPLSGRLVCFLSDTFYHEVLPSQADRLSITGWFRTRA